jgi:hypothetical protein
MLSDMKDLIHVSLSVLPCLESYYKHQKESSKVLYNCPADRGVATIPPNIPITPTPTPGLCVGGVIEALGRMFGYMGIYLDVCLDACSDRTHVPYLGQLIWTLLVIINITEDQNY